MLSATVTFFLLSLACPAAAAPPSAGPQAEPTPSLADQFAAIKKEHEQRERQFRDELRAAADREKARRISKEQNAFTRRQADRIVALVRSHRDDPAAFDGILVLAGTVHSFLPDDLVKLVLERHTAHPRMGELCFHLCYRTSEEWAERIIKAAVNHPVPETRGQMVYALADYCRGRAVRLAGEQQPMPEDAKRGFAQAERHYTDVTKNYADVRTPDGSARLGDKAAAELARLRNRTSLVVGRPAPEIAGEDIDGKPMKLSDYRGKVILLTFWGHWCGPCRSMYPHERSLVKRLERQPFALLGVNSDTDRAEIKKVIQKEPITWRNWWDGGSRHGSIATAWNVEGWPTLYVIDHRGVIRHKWQGAIDAKKLDDAVNELLDELKTGVGPARRAEQAKTNRICFFDRTRVTCIDPDGQNREPLPRVLSSQTTGWPYYVQTHTARLAPDRRRLAIAAVDMNARPQGNVPWRIYLLDVTEQKGSELLADLPGVSPRPAAWSPDGTKLACVSWEGRNKWRNWVVDVATRKVEELRLPSVKTAAGEEHQLGIKDWSPDGQWFLAADVEGLHLIKTDGSQRKPVADMGRRVSGQCCHFSPDGRRVLFDVARNGGGFTLYVVDLAGGKPRAVVELANADPGVLRAGWSPDGRRIVYSFTLVDGQGKPGGETRLNVVDADGQNAATLIAEKHEPSSIRLLLLDWR